MTEAIVLQKDMQAAMEPVLAANRSLVEQLAIVTKERDEARSFNDDCAAAVQIAIRDNDRVKKELADFKRTYAAVIEDVDAKAAEIERELG